jgi:hypothetical protein
LRANNIPMESIAVSGMNRGLQYSLSFYLHKEIPAWEPAKSNIKYLLTSSKNCKRVVEPNFECEVAPLELSASGRFLYRIVSVKSSEQTSR